MVVLSFSAKDMFHYFIIVKFYDFKVKLWSSYETESLSDGAIGESGYCDDFNWWGRALPFHINGGGERNGSLTLRWEINTLYTLFIYYSQ